MKKTFISFLFLISLSARAQQITLEGYVGLPGISAERNLPTRIRTPETDYIMNFYALPEKTKELLLKENGSKNKIKIEIPKEALVNTEKFPGAVRPDCSEMPFDYKQLTDLANNPKITNQIDFLKAIPPGTLQTFTFNFKSQSAQGPGVSREFPGIIRMSQDGKLVIRYTCDPSKPTFNRIEVLTFDDSSKKYKLASIDFSKKPQAGHGGRIEDNPKLCLKCHNPGGDKAPIDPRPNWQAYDQWTGFYGSEDDTFDGNNSFFSETKISRDEGRKQQEDYLRFREKQKDNPCYSTLPWPQESVEEPNLYPYSSRSRNYDYRRRPGLKFTEVQCHLAGKRLARKLKEKPEYELVKYSLTMETLRCDEFQPNQLFQVLPEMKTGPFKKNNSDIGIEEHTGAFEVGKTLGFRNQDWTLHFNKNDKAQYNCGISGDPDRYLGRDLTIADIMQGELVKDTLKGTGLDKDISYSRGEAAAFGDSFACIDELGGQAFINPNVDRDKVCGKLAKLQENHEKKVIAPLAARKVLDEYQKQREKDCQERDGFQDNIGELLEVGLHAALEGQEPDEERGKQIVKTVCMECHNPDFEGLDFFTSDDTFKSHLQKNPQLLDLIKDRLYSKDEPMPPDRDLKPTEKEDVLKYLNTFLKK